VSLEGRAAVVTGGGSGIGRAASVALARVGARLLLVGRSEESLSESAREVEAAGGEYPEDVFDEVIAVNLRGVFLGLRHVLPVMLRQGSGSIVNTGSLASERGLPLTAAYNASKHAVVGLTKTAAAEVGAAGVRVNAVLPGMIDTRMLRSLVDTMSGGDMEAGMQFVAGVAPQGRTGTVEEVAAIVAFLASDAASFVNGVAWPVDGGALATMANN
jgi:3alpha(or 20beta)-hydroxysteroid dehydrogenase